MPEVITTYRLTRDTAGLLENIAEGVFDKEINAQRLATYLGSPGHLMIIAVCGKQVIGQVAAYVHSHLDEASDVYIDNLGVAPPFQQRGVARRLVDEVFAWGKTLNVTRRGSLQTSKTMPLAPSTKVEAPQPSRL